MRTFHANNFQGTSFKYCSIHISSNRLKSLCCSPIDAHHDILDDLEVHLQVGGHII